MYILPPFLIKAFQAFSEIITYYYCAGLTNTAYMHKVITLQKLFKLKEQSCYSLLKLAEIRNIYII